MSGSSLMADLRAKHPTEKPARKTTPRNDNATGPDVFSLARDVDALSVLDWLNIEHDGKHATCPGCKEDGALICEHGGLKCLHNRCSDVGPPGFPGFRSNVDLVVAVRGGAPLEAAKDICQRFGIEIPKATKEREQKDQSTPGDAPPAERNHLTPHDVIARWASSGPLVRIPTGISPLDELCRGGLPVPWCVLIVGAPGAGKTFVEGVIADKLAREAEAAGMVVGVLAVDEDPEDVTVRLAQMAGFSVEAAEARGPETLLAMAQALAGLRLRMYDAAWTIEAAAEDMAAWGEAENRKVALFVDSIQTARSDLGTEAKSPRELVEANVRAVKWASAQLRMLVVSTSEANRSSYRSQDAAETTNDLAAGAESRVIEFAGQTLLVLRTPKGHDDIVHVRVAKNRRASRGEFWLKLDRNQHLVTPCPDPAGTPEARSEVEERKQAANLKKVRQDAEQLAAFLTRHSSGLGVRELRAALAAEGWKWGQPRLDAAKAVLISGHKGVRLVEIDNGAGKQKQLRLDRDTFTDADNDLD